MDNFTYLNEISQSNRPVKNPAAQSKGILNKSTVIKIVIGGVVLFFMMMAVGALLSNMKNKTTELSKQLYTRTTNLNSVLTTFNPHLKGSSLRSTGLSLAGVLTNATTQLGKYVNPEAKNPEDLKPSADTLASEVEIVNNLNLTLENAKLNGILDRTYANQIGLQVSLLMVMISELEERTDNEDLKKFLQSYHTSLEAIDKGFEDYEGIGS